MHDGILEDEQQDAGQDGVNDAHAQGDKGALFDTVDLARTKVLAHKGGGRHAEAQHRQNVEAIHLHIGGKACHGSGTIAVDADLHQHIGKGDDHILDAGGQAHLDDADRHLFVHAHFLCRHAVIVLHPHQKTQGKHTGHQLADIGGNGRTGHAHLASGDQDKVEDDVGDGGSAQVEQAPLGVAGGVQDTGRHVIHHAEQHTAKIEPHIEHRILQHLCGGVHGGEQGPADGNAAHGQDRTQNGRKGQRGVHRSVRALPVLGSQKLGHHDTGTHGNTLAEPDEQEDGRSAGADGCQRVAAHKVAHDDGIGGVVQLLQHVAQDQRHREEQDALPDAALCHQP